MDPHPVFRTFDAGNRALYQPCCINKGTRALTLHTPAVLAALRRHAKTQPNVVVKTLRRRATAMAFVCIYHTITQIPAPARRPCCYRDKTEPESTAQLARQCPAPMVRRLHAGCRARPFRKGTVVRDYYRVKPDAPSKTGKSRCNLPTATGFIAGTRETHISAFNRRNATNRLFCAPDAFAMAMQPTTASYGGRQGWYARDWHFPLYGDLRGLTSQLDHLQQSGVNACG